MIFGFTVGVRVREYKGQCGGEKGRGERVGADLAVKMGERI